MAKTSNLYVRIEPELKKEAENILETLGIPASNAITMFYKQIIFHRGLPFDVKIPSSCSLDINSMTESEINERLEKGYMDVIEGRMTDAEESFKEIRESIGL